MFQISANIFTVTIREASELNYDDFWLLTQAESEISREIVTT